MAIQMMLVAKPPCLKNYTEILDNYYPINFHQTGDLLRTRTNRVIF